MALATYSDLQTAISNELKKSLTEFTTAIPDMIARCEAKLNRRLRLRNMEIQATANYGSTDTTRRLAMPSTMLEMLNLWIKKASEADTDYVLLKQVPPTKMARYYTTASDDITHYAWRNDIEFNAAASVDHTVKMHYIKGWDIASDSTNWLLTNFPDAYLYGSCMESELYWGNDPRAPTWKALFDEAIEELNKLDDRSRDDAELDNRQTVAMASRRRGGWNIFTG